jgi:hypothetical protein
MRSGRVIWRMLYRCLIHIFLLRGTHLIFLRLIALISRNEERKLLCYYLCNYLTNSLQLLYAHRSRYPYVIGVKAVRLRKGVQKAVYCTRFYRPACSIQISVQSVVGMEGIINYSGL